MRARRRAPLARSCTSSTGASSHNICTVLRSREKCIQHGHTVAGAMCAICRMRADARIHTLAGHQHKTLLNKWTDRVFGEGMEIVCISVYYAIEIFIRNVPTISMAYYTQTRTRILNPPPASVWHSVQHTSHAWCAFVCKNPGRRCTYGNRASARSVRHYARHARRVCSCVRVFVCLRVVIIAVTLGTAGRTIGRPSGTALTTGRHGLPIPMGGPGDDRVYVDTEHWRNHPQTITLGYTHGAHTYSHTHTHTNSHT